MTTRSRISGLRSNRSYTIDEIAAVRGVHPNTVRSWMRQGLAAIDDEHKALIHGAALIEFLGERGRRRKQPCGPGRFFCMRCRAPKKPAGGIADFQAGPGSKGTLIGICPDCNAMMYRRASRMSLDDVAADIDVTITTPDPRLSGRPTRLVNCDFET